MRKVIVVSGPRAYNNFNLVLWGLECLARGCPGLEIVIREGGAKGVDACARDAAKALGLTLEPSWKPKYNVPDAQGSVNNGYAPLQRTEDMLDGVHGPVGCLTADIGAELLVVFRDTPELDHGGTAHAVREARKRRIPVIVFEWPPYEA
jgi:hypothetical protein